MQRWVLLLLVLVNCSCDFFSSTEEKTEKEVRAALSEIDWNEVDTYPMFDECDEYAPKAEQRNCFTEQLLARFADTLSSLNLIVVQELNDTLLIDFIVDENGFIIINEIKENASITDAFPGLEKDIAQRLNDITTVAPATKRSIPVSIKIRLPILLNTAD